eukprot:GGOE01044274.1.p1 GENE.GGOE01044274.1~~GGOE01044274.1.p1  ORF type:complete len:489 (+),score=71.87 GGOE01044274.1:90-1469(+)
MSKARKAAEERIHLAKVLARQAALLDRQGSIRTIASNLAGPQHIPQNASAELELLEQEAEKLRESLMSSQNSTLDEQAAAACRIAVETSRLAAKLALDQTDPDLRRSVESQLTPGLTDDEPTVTYISETNIHSTLNLGNAADITKRASDRLSDPTIEVQQPSPIPHASPLSGRGSDMNAIYLTRLANATRAQPYEAATPPRPPAQRPLNFASAPVPVQQTLTAAAQQLPNWGFQSAFQGRARTVAVDTVNTSFGEGRRASVPLHHQRSRSTPASAPQLSPSRASPQVNQHTYTSYQRGAPNPIDRVRGSWGFLQFRDDTTTPRNFGLMAGPVFDDNSVLSVNHYHHGDHHHNHWQRHVHHFHDVHVLGSADEVLDLHSDHIQVESTVIPGESMPQMKLRPDVIGRQAFEDGMDSFIAGVRQKYGFPPPVADSTSGPGFFPSREGLQPSTRSSHSALSGR